MLYPQPVAAMLERARSGKTCFGVHHSAMSPQLVEMYGRLRLDFVIVGTEVESIARNTMENLMRAADAGGTVPIVKLSRNDPSLIDDALNSGAPFVTIPHITTRKELDDAVRASRFKPKGLRGLCPLARYNGYGTESIDRVFEATNSARCILPIIEDVEAIDHIDDLMSSPDVEIYEVGPFDLSSSLGLRRELTYGNPETMRIVEKVANAARRYNKQLMVPLWITPETDSPAKIVSRQVDELLSRGVTMFYGLEMMLVARLFRDLTPLRETRRS